MHTAGSVGRVERKMKESGGELKNIGIAVNGIAAHLLSQAGKYQEGSILTNYSDDDTDVWKEFRRELIKDGFRSSLIHRHKSTIIAYVKELGSSGSLDDEDPHILQEKIEEAVQEKEHIPEVENDQIHPSVPQMENLSLQVNRQRSFNDIDGLASQSRSSMPSDNSIECPGQSTDLVGAVSGTSCHDVRCHSKSEDEMLSSNCKDQSSIAHRKRSESSRGFSNEDVKDESIDQYSRISKVQPSDNITTMSQVQSDEPRMEVPTIVAELGSSGKQESIQSIGSDSLSIKDEGSRQLDFVQIPDCLAAFAAVEKSEQTGMLQQRLRSSDEGSNSISSQTQLENNATQEAGISISDRARRVNETVDLYHTKYQSAFRKLCNSPLKIEDTVDIRNLIDDLSIKVVPVLEGLRWVHPGWGRESGAEIDQLLMEIRHTIESLDEVLEDNPTQWLERLRVDFYDDVMGSLISMNPYKNRDLSRQRERTANLTRKLRQNMVRLDDIPSRGVAIDLKFKKSQIRYDMERTLGVLLLIQNDSRWTWSNGEQIASELQHYSPKIITDEKDRVIVYQRWQQQRRCAFHGLRPWKLRQRTTIVESGRRDCISCLADYSSAASRVRLECSHCVCRVCVRTLFFLSLEDSESMPPACCTGAPINFRVIQDLCSQDFKKTWKREYLKYRKSELALRESKGTNISRN